VEEDKETNTAVEGHKREHACEIMVYDSTISVGKCSRTEMIAINASSSTAMRFGSSQALHAGPGNTGTAST
jgi:hypothetical protein